MSYTFRFLKLRSISYRIRCARAEPPAPRGAGRGLWGLCRGGCSAEATEETLSWDSSGVGAGRDNGLGFWKSLEICAEFCTCGEFSSERVFPWRDVPPPLPQKV